MINYAETIISQYSSSPTITELINLFNQCIDTDSNIDDFYNDVWNVDTAIGFGLDIWGRIVGVSRNISTDAGDVTLSDADYRILIMLKAASNLSDSSIPTTNNFLRDLFEVSGRVYVWDPSHPPVAFTNSMQFKADGVLQDYQLVGNLGQSASNPSITSATQRDWQGTRHIYTTPRTNLWTKSEDFADIAWDKTYSGTGSIPVVTSDYVTAPDPSKMADRIVFNRGAGSTALDYSIISRTVSVNAGEDYDDGIWVKSNTGSTQSMMVYFYGITGASSSHVVSATTAWTRIDLQGAALGTLAGIQFGTRATYGAATLDISVFGAQLENGLGGTYLPTDVATSTRVDYEVDSSGIVTFWDVPTKNTIFEFRWSGIGSTWWQDVMKLRYIFEYEPTAIQKALLTQSGIVPRPAGVRVDALMINRDNTFGFNGSGLQPFNQGTFNGLTRLA